MNSLPTKRNTNTTAGWLGLAQEVVIGLINFGDFVGSLLEPSGSYGDGNKSHLKLQKIICCPLCWRFLS
jgi:hypothetical protein